MEANYAQLLDLLEQKNREYRALLERENPNLIKKALSFLEYRRQLLEHGANISFDESLQKLDWEVQRIFALMKQYAEDIKVIFLENGGVLTHISDVSPENMEGGKIRKSFNRLNNYETECGNWLFASSAPINGDNVYIARKPQGMIALTRDVYIYGGDNMVVRSDEEGNNHLYLKEPNYIYKINPLNFSPVVTLKLDRDGKPYFEFSEEWISNEEVSITDKEQVLEIESVSDITSLLYNYQIFCDIQMRGLARRIISTGSFKRGIELLNEYTENGSLLYMNGLSGININPEIRSAYLKQWKERILLEIKYHFEGEVESDIFEMIKKGEILPENAETKKIEETQMRVDAYIAENGGIDNIVNARITLVNAFDRVIDAFRNCRDMTYFEKKEKMEPVLKEFYDVIKINYTSINSLWEYNEYLSMIREFARVGISYPFSEEISYEKSKGEPEQTLDTLVSLIRDKVCKLDDGTYSFYNRCAECQKTFNDIVGVNSRISNKSLDTQFSMGLPAFQHSFNLIKVDNRFFIVDMTFAQFCDISYTPDILGIPGIAAGNPGFYLMDSPAKVEFLKQLITKGYFEATEENMKMYLDAFVLANRNFEFYRNHASASTRSTGISAKEYIKSILEGKKLFFGKPEELGSIQNTDKYREFFE